MGTKEGAAIPDISQFQHDVLDQYSGDTNDLAGNVRDPLWLALVACGDRKAAWLHTKPPAIGAADLEQWFEEGALAYRGATRGGYLIASNADRFDLLPSERADEVLYQQQLGEFLSYPREAIAARVENRAATMSERRIDVRRSVIDVDTLAFGVFVPYAPVRSIAGYERAIAAGKRTAKRLDEIANVWDLPGLADTARRCYQRERAQLRPPMKSGWVERVRHRYEGWRLPPIEKRHARTDGGPR